MRKIGALAVLKLELTELARTNSTLAMWHFIGTLLSSTSSQVVYKELCLSDSFIY